MGEPREKPPGTPASRTWIVSHVASEGLEPTQDMAVVDKLTKYMLCLMQGSSDIKALLRIESNISKITIEYSLDNGPHIYF